MTTNSLKNGLLRFNCILFNYPGKFKEKIVQIPSTSAYLLNKTGKYNLLLIYPCSLYSYHHILFVNIGQNHTRNTGKAASANPTGRTGGIFLQEKSKWNSVCAWWKKFPTFLLTSNRNSYLVFEIYKKLLNGAYTEPRKNSIMDIQCSLASITILPAA